MKDLKSKKSKIITKKSNVDINDANLFINLIEKIVNLLPRDLRSRGGSSRFQTRQIV
jgi:hypothetical protein